MDTTIEKPRGTPKDFFLHLGALITLYISVMSLLSLLFDVINNLYPDSLNYYSDPYSGAMRLAIASLIIVFPIHLLVSWLIGRDVKMSPEKRDLGIRKWLTYFTLFVAGLAMMIDLIVLLNTFLNGEITARFILKVLSVLLVAGIIFAYYILDVRKIQEKKTKIFAYIAIIAVLASIVGGFVVMGSPLTARKLRFDSQRVSDLQSIQWQVVNFWQSKSVLPSKLTDLEDPILGFQIPKDPETKAVYSYESTGALSFKLCATFDLDNTNSTNRTVPKVYDLSGNSDTWNHAVGKVCFDRTIDPKLYPPRKN